MKKISKRRFTKDTLVFMVFGVFFLIVATTDCFPQTQGKKPGPATVGSITQNEPALTQRWDEWLKAGKKEGSVTIYSGSGPDVRTALTKGFYEKYGINLEWVVGTQSETTAKIMEERNAGLYLADIYLDGTSGTIVTLLPAKILDPIDQVLVLPEVTDSKAWLYGKPSYSDREEKYIIVQVGSPSPGVEVNTNLVKKSDIQAFKDLLNPTWRGKISMSDPTVPGNGARWFRSVAELMGNDFLKDLAKQELVIMRDGRLRFEWLARGKIPISLGHSTDLYAQFTKIGAPIAAYYLKEGAWVTGRTSGLSLVNKAPHPNAARVFINWLLTKEGQTIYSKATRTQSLRVDVPYDYLLPEEVRQPGGKYIMVENAAYLEKDEEYRVMAREVFKDLLK